MEITTQKAVDMLTHKSVSIRTTKSISIDGTQTQIGENHRCAYTNSLQGRANLQVNEPPYVVNAVLAIWDSLKGIEEQ